MIYPEIRTLAQSVADADDVAQQADVSPSTVRSFQRGNSVTMLSAMKILQATGMKLVTVPVDYEHTTLWVNGEKVTIIAPKGLDVA